MESSPKHKNKLVSRGAKAAALFVLAASLRAGDKPEYGGGIWVGGISAEGVQLAGAGRSAHLGSQMMRVATYNLKGGDINRDKAISTARSLGADVLGLTEAGDTAGAIAGNTYHVAYGGAGNV